MDITLRQKISQIIHKITNPQDDIDYLNKTYLKVPNIQSNLKNGKKIFLRIYILNGIQELKVLVKQSKPSLQTAFDLLVEQLHCSNSKVSFCLGFAFDWYIPYQLFVDSVSDIRVAELALRTLSTFA